LTPPVIEDTHRQTILHFLLLPCFRASSGLACLTVR
jgi:hypothetical protein